MAWLAAALRCMLLCGLAGVFPLLLPAVASLFSLLFESVKTRDMDARACTDGLARFRMPVFAPRFARFYSSGDLPEHEIIDMPALSPTMTTGALPYCARHAAVSAAARD